MMNISLGLKQWNSGTECFFSITLSKLQKRFRRERRELIQSGRKVGADLRGDA